MWNSVEISHINMHEKHLLSFRRLKWMQQSTRELRRVEKQHRGERERLKKFKTILLLLISFWLLEFSSGLTVFPHLLCLMR
jgi:hypothetical protein